MDRKHSKLVTVIGGGVAGATETICTYPAEYVKTRRQIPSSSPEHKPQKSFHLLRETLRVSGVRGLYSGCSALVASNAAKGGIRFMSFTQSQELFRNSRLGQSNPGLCTVFAGLTAGATESILVVTPGESLKTKIIHDRAGGGRLGLSNSNLVQATIRVVRIDGLKALWNGLGPVLCKQGMNSAVRFATFSSFQDRLRQNWDMTGVGATLIAGAASGVVTTYASMPFDNLKTRMQILGRTKNVTMFSLAVQMLKVEGPTVFWRATTPRLVRLTISSAVTFTVFNQVVALAHWNRKDTTKDVNSHFKGLAL